MMREVSFADWYRENHPGLVDAAIRAIGQPALAADAVDEACERALARWERVQSMRSPNGWVFRVAVNEARRQLRRSARDRDLGPFLTGPEVAPPPGGEAWLVVDELPPRQRFAVILRHVAGLTEAEIAARMGVTRSTVSSTLASAYQRLALTLGEPPTEEIPSRMTLALAVARSCDADGCDVEPLDGGGGARRAGYSDAVRDAIKVRPGDLVALDGDTIVWRWWHGTVVSVDATAGSATVRRNATQRSADDPRTVDLPVSVPADLVAELAAGDVVYFGSEGDDGEKFVIATAAPEVVLERVAPKLPGIAEVV